MANLPLLKGGLVYHVGEMDPSLKRTDSHEGRGLSVSLHPSEWRAIGEGLISGPCWSLSKDDGAFLDAHALGRIRRKRILAWAVEKGYAVSCDTWTWTYFDDEREEEMTQTFADRTEAEEERDYAESGSIRKRRGHASTPLLDGITMQSSPSLSNRDVIDLVLPLWAHEVHGIGAVWWSDTLDPILLSAPRGVIHPDAVEGWKATRMENDPETSWDDDDGCPGEDDGDE
jgi:hypothetical protein